MINEVFIIPYRLVCVMHDILESIATCFKQ